MIRSNNNLKISLFLVFCLLSIFFGCNKGNKKNILKINSAWIEDSLGCTNKRNDILAEKMINGNKLENTSIEEFHTIFGKSNETEHDGSIVTFIYYFGSACTNNSLQKKSDKCYARFVFDKGRLIDRSYSCE